MRKKLTGSGLTVNMIAGTHVVLMGMDLSDAVRGDCLGFAIHREDHTEQESYWLEGMKTFASVLPHLPPCQKVSSRDHPYQTFQWSDYTAKPDHDYTYTVVALKNTPQQPQEGAKVAIRIQTEPEIGTPHSVFFNRGAAASQEYACRFHNQAPSVFGQEAYDWLSRGLKEAMIAFIGRANDPSYRLYGAIYEFQWHEVLDVLGAANKKCGGVQIVYDRISDSPGKPNDDAIKAAKITAFCKKRTTGKIMHNKFFVLVKNGTPIAVWTGSTNITEVGIFGHSNFGHIVEDERVAKAYLAYWNELKTNPDDKTEKEWVGAHNPAPPAAFTDNPTIAYSPRIGLKVLQWYADIAAGGFDSPPVARPLFMTFAFGMHPMFQKIYSQQDGILRMALMENAGQGQKAVDEIQAIRNLPNVVVAKGNYIKVNALDTWVQEINRISKTQHVIYVHTKYMLVDPLGADPIIVAGSANFSAASTDTNNENMIVIRGDTRVADIYLGEFSRLFTHYSFREALEWALAKGIQPQDWQPNHLVEDPSWQKKHFQPGTDSFLRRKYFSGN